ncbi:MAG: hypothetical protein JXR64_06090 [Spirochaetales bacterium]|nr:hypothetical protein [Spirochaetales bacterium]
MKTGNKKILSILILLVTIVMLSSATKSPYYNKTVVVTKVYPHKLGYLVYYMANDLSLKSAYLPQTLFDQQEPGVERSKVFTGYGKEYPYLTIFWKEGSFSHVKLYLVEGYSDFSWGSLANPDAHDENFKNAKLEFDF